MDYLVILGITLAIFLTAVISMSVGVLISNRTIKGSCGGLANLKDREGNSICEACTKPSPECRGVAEAAHDHED
ncbi:MAG: hypothetical protein CMJ46_16740 [Planctomyces sp.]|nr:hypothetical protein [Planctomyces sp.]